MEAVIAGQPWEVDDLICAGPRLLTDDPDKTGVVRRWGRSGPRDHLAAVQTARLLVEEYPEDCLPLGPGIRGPRGEDAADAILAVTRAQGRVRVWTRLDPEQTQAALARLERYLTRLVRLDTP
ncbi:MAG: hypothetical protein GXP50_07445 [Deltaproteobacteria bacterium]|nr:hypothetical protein [Deltaproteobacteria bacterium]